MTALYPMALWNAWNRKLLPMSKEPLDYIPPSIEVNIQLVRRELPLLEGHTHIIIANDGDDIIIGGQKFPVDLPIYDHDEEDFIQVTCHNPQDIIAWAQQRELTQLFILEIK